MEGAGLTAQAFQDADLPPVGRIVERQVCWLERPALGAVDEGLREGVVQAIGIGLIDALDTTWQCIEPGTDAAVSDRRAMQPEGCLVDKLGVAVQLMAGEGHQLTLDAVEGLLGARLTGAETL